MTKSQKILQFTESSKFFILIAFINTLICYWCNSIPNGFLAFYFSLIGIIKVFYGQ